MIRIDLALEKLTLLPENAREYGEIIREKV